MIGIALSGGPGQVIFLKNGTGWGCVSRRSGFRGGFLTSFVSPPSAVTDQDGRFELEGVSGAGGEAYLGFKGYESSHRAAGSAEMGVVVLKREK